MKVNHNRTNEMKTLTETLMYKGNKCLLKTNFKHKLKLTFIITGATHVFMIKIVKSLYNVNILFAFDKQQLKLNII